MRAYNLETAIKHPEAIQELYLHQANLEVFPNFIFDLPQLRKLEITRCRLSILPKRIGQCTQLEVLNLGNNQLKQLPLSIKNLTALHTIDLSANALEEVPTVLLELPNLEILNVANNQLIELPKSIGRWLRLKKLFVQNNRLKKLPPRIGECLQLQQLHLAHNLLSVLPKSIGHLIELNHLDLSNNRLKKIPESIGQCLELEIIDLSRNRLTALPDAMGQWSMLQQIWANKNKLQAIPTAIRHCQRLRKIQFKDNQLNDLPYAFRYLNRLEELSLENNRFNEIPEAIFGLRKLRQLHLRKNKIQKVPDAIADLSTLTVIDVADNPITHLTPNLHQLKKLQQLFFRNPTFSTFPNVLLLIPNIQKITGLQKTILETGQPLSLSSFVQQCNKLALNFSLRIDLFEFLIERKIPSNKWTIDSCLQVLNIPNRILQLFAFDQILKKHSLPLTSHPIGAKSQIALLGRHHFDLKQLKKQLTKIGLPFSLKPNEQTTHVVLGNHPKQTDFDFYHRVVFIREQTLQAYLNSKCDFYLLHAKEEKLEQLKNMLCSEEETNIKMALQMLKGGGVPKLLLTALFLASRSPISSGLKKEARALLILNASPATQKTLSFNRPLRTARTGEMIRANIDRYTHDSELDRTQMIQFLEK